MNRLQIATAAWLSVAFLAAVADARVWTDSTGQYTLQNPGYVAGPVRRVSGV